MATFKKRGKYSYQAVIRIAGQAQSRSKTFNTRAEAEEWASQTEDEIRSGMYPKRLEAERLTLRDALQKYLETETPKKRGADQERRLISRLAKKPLAKKAVGLILSEDLATHRDTRLNEVSPTTVTKELCLFSSLFDVARREWGLVTLGNPCKSITYPPAKNERKRRLQEHELTALLDAALNSKDEKIFPAIVLALVTGLRRKNLADLTWEQVDLVARKASIPLTKNGRPLEIPLFKLAREVIGRLKTLGGGGGAITKILGYQSAEALSQAFRRVCQAAAIEDFRFHDLRHAAATEYAKKFAAQELARFFGWATIQMALRYYHPTTDELLNKIEPEHAVASKDVSLTALLTAHVEKWLTKESPSTITAEDLEKMVWSQPMTTVASQLGISDVAVRKRCLKLGVPTPPRGYWTKLKTGSGRCDRSTTTHPGSA